MVYAFIYLLILASAFGQSCDYKSHESLGQEVMNELISEGMKCNGQPVHMTFDDGPSSAVTPKLLKELKLRNIKASFFVTTSRLMNSPTSQQMVRDTMDQGHLIANHGHDHDAYDLKVRGDTLIDPGMSQEKREDQIQKSYDLLNQATAGKFKNQKAMLFRFPYGRGAMPSPGEIKYLETHQMMSFSSRDYSKQLSEYRNQSPALQTLQSRGFSHLGWNHDSDDSKFPNAPMEPQVLKDHIKNNLRSLCAARGPQVALFHDIKVFNLDVVPVVLDIGKCMGLKFISPDQMIGMKSSFMANNVLIEKSEIQKAPVRNLASVIDGLRDVAKAEACLDEGEKSCYSKDYDRYYSDCSGGDSVCYRGKWFKASDPMIKNKCPNR